MKKFLKRLVTLVLAVTLIFGVAQFDAYAANSYKINGVTVSLSDYSSSPNECWWFANHLYKKIWGHNFTNQFSDSENTLRNLSDKQLTLTPEHLKAYVLNAEIGSVLRVCDSQYLHANDGWGHSQLIVQKDANGFTVLEGGLSAFPYKREHYYTWDNFCNSRWPGKYQYIKYVKWPGAPAYEEPSGTLTATCDAYSSSVNLTWTTYWDYTAEYLIKRAEEKDGPWTTVQKISDGGTSWTDETVEPGKCYFYKVQPYNDSGKAGSHTEVAQILTPAALTLEPVSDDTPSILLKWTKTEGYTSGYWVQRAAKESGPWTTVKTCNGGNLTSWADSDIESGVVYYYRVQPYNALEKGGTYSNLASAKAFKLAADSFDGVVSRVYGSSRYRTSYQIADELKAVLGVEKFDTVILATGANFADALSGSYLAYVNSAPIILTNGGTDADAVTSYLENNLTEDGMVYILGGTKAVSEDMEAVLKDYQVKRIKGANRYETNIEILKEAGVSEEDIIVCTGANYADSLSASAAKKPILLVGDCLNDKQKEYLDGISCEMFYIVGGNAAVSQEVEEALLANGSIKRISGSSRYKTSLAVAKEFVLEPEAAVIAYGRNFPDGLCGGPLASHMNAALILSEENVAISGNEYVEMHQIKEGVVLGGAAAVSDLAAKVIFGMSAEDELINKKYK